jgi:hypothetical protein
MGPIDILLAPARLVLVPERGRVEPLSERAR